MQLDTVRPVYERPGPYVTIHADVSRTDEGGRDQLDARWTTIRHRLEGSDLDDALVESLERRFKENVHLPGEARRTIVVGEGEVLLDDVQPGHATWPEVCEVAALPDLSGWVRGAAGELPFVLVQADRTGADIDLYHAASAPPDDQRTVEGESFYVTKVPQGDWAQKQFQQTAEDNWKQNARGVADEVAGVVRRHRPRAVLVAGDVRAVGALTDELEGLQVDVVRLETGGRAAGTSEDALQVEIERVVAEFVAHDERDVMDTLEATSGREQGESAVGVSDVLDALVRGQVQTLVLDPGRAAEEEVRPSDHEGLPLPPSLPTDEALPADRVLLAAAALSDADVVVLDEGRTSSPVSAILRWSSD